MQTLARKLSFEYKQLKKLLALCKEQHDSITFDYIAKSPAPYRFNVYNKIDIKNESDEEN